MHMYDTHYKSTFYSQRDQSEQQVSNIKISKKVSETHTTLQTWRLKMDTA